MGSVFISYTRADKNMALELYDFLKGNGYSPWLDVKNLLPGQEWKVEIENAIRQSDVFITCLTTNCVNKTGFVQAEFREALEVAKMMPEGKIFIIPVRFEECNVPNSLQKYHWLDYFDTGEREKLIRAIELRIKPAETSQLRDEKYFDAGERVKLVREELGISTSQFVEVLDFSSQREYEFMENRQKEFPLSLLKKISNISGANLDWLKHAKSPRYRGKHINLNSVDDALAFCDALQPLEYFLVLDKKRLNIALVAQTSKYYYQFITIGGVTLDFWNWVEHHWAILAFYKFLKGLSDPWHDIDGVLLPTNIYKQLDNGEIHFLVAYGHMEHFAGDLLYDILDIDHQRRGLTSYAKRYGGNWMEEVHKYFKVYLNDEVKANNRTVNTPTKTEVNVTDTNLEKDLTQVLKGTYEAARKRGYVATYFLQMLEEHGGAETAKRLLSKSEAQTGLFELWELGLLHESMEAVVLQEKFKSLFTDDELAEAHRRLEELGYFQKGK